MFRIIIFNTLNRSSPSRGLGRCCSWQTAPEPQVTGLAESRYLARSGSLEDASRLSGCLQGWCRLAHGLGKLMATL